MDNAPLQEYPDVEFRSDDEALAAAYAALGQVCGSMGEEVEVQAELGSPSARAVAMPLPRHSDSDGDSEIELRVLHS
jgi:hypothetical protein